MENSDNYTFRNGILIAFFFLFSTTMLSAAGLTFRIDIGTFDVPVVAEKLNGYDYIITEKMDGSFNYRVGEFKDYINAQRARNDLKGRGFIRTEVVAFFNEHEIDMESAFVMMDNQNSADAKRYAGLPDVPVEELNRKLDNLETAFRVQVGVYSKAQDPESFDLPFEVVEVATPDGRYKYYSQDFVNVDDAREAKRAAADNGVSDAFLVAFRHGERIAMQEALQGR